jgi:hypothetical protein
MYSIGLENNVEGRSIAWVLGHPGCFAYGADGPSALAASEQAIVHYAGWVAAHNGDWIPQAPVDIQLAETWDVYIIDESFELAMEGYEVNAWFQHDWKPLSAEDVERGLKLLTWTQADLLATVQGLDPVGLERTYPGERWSIAGILNHIGGAEWWYLDRLGLAFPRVQVPTAPFERLEAVRQRLIEVLPTLVGSSQVNGVDGEIWSPRKLLRRAVWHMRDHIHHIQKLLDL